MVELKPGFNANIAGPFHQSVEHLRLSMDAFRTMLTGKNLGSWSFWVFLYLTLCIGGHLAPSPADLHNALIGFGFFLLLLFIVNIIIQAAGGLSSQSLIRATSFLSPIAALLMLAIMLKMLLLIPLYLLCFLTVKVRHQSAIDKLVAPFVWYILGIILLSALSFAGGYLLNT